ESGPGGGPTDPCVSACQMEAMQAYHACTEHGGSAADCENAAKQAFDACHAARCTAPGGGPGDGGTGTGPGDGSGPGPGGGPDAGGPGPGGGLGDGGGPTTGSGDGSCREQCGKTAYAAFQACVAAGTAEDTCRGQAKDAYLQCLADTSCTTAPSCADRCSALAGKVNDHCLELGGMADVCTAAAQPAATPSTPHLSPPAT